MRLKEAVYDNCGECGRQKSTISEESFGCDGCHKPIDEQLRSGNTKHHDYLEVTVFFNGDHSTKRLQYCSWKCCLKHLPKVKCDHFISLPYLLFDTNQKGIRAKDFFNALKGAHE